MKFKQGDSHDLKKQLEYLNNKSINPLGVQIINQFSHQEFKIIINQSIKYSNNQSI